ncbi:MAG: hypothetical protein EXS31_08755 [Pedosphaera sp.]|nr:hypothetical protein [Pedosphaera sp.]
MHHVADLACQFVAVDGLAQALDSSAWEESHQPRRLAPRSPVSQAVHCQVGVEPEVARLLHTTAETPDVSVNWRPVGPPSDSSAAGDLSPAPPAARTTLQRVVNETMLPSLRIGFPVCLKFLRATLDAFYKEGS